jgi:S-adenosylhomocysteine hydrolase
MEEPLTAIIEENTEEVTKQYWGADEATATVENRLTTIDSTSSSRTKAISRTPTNRSRSRTTPATRESCSSIRRGRNTVVAVYVFLTEENRGAQIRHRLHDEDYV